MELSNNDPTGESFRYSKTNEDEAITNTVQIAPATLYRIVEETSNYLYALYDYCTNGEG